MMDKRLVQKINNGREYRNMSLRANDEESNSYIVEGYATTFNEPYTLFDFGDYRVDEVIDSRAFDECDMSDVIMQYDHMGRVYARLKNKTLELKIDEHGLFISADLGGTEEGRKLYDEIKGGYTDKMSFGFIVAEDKESSVMVGNVEIVTRTITKISKLFDVSAVSIPANDATEISARGYANGVIEAIQLEKAKRAKRKEALELRKRKLILTIKLGELK